jgi:hypothetical protein
MSGRNIKLMIDGTPSPSFSAKAIDSTAVEKPQIGEAESTIGPKKADRTPVPDFL